ncbi:acyl-CoA thioesterase [Mycolicibacterium stellerae]|uniref:acyl-CoA thioesterase n=1 Tax=Mycolicibacterium stellerae TaxID=2358193 RepID=UPI0013DE4F66|nr:hotdog domain-containing protein [Mycolicibacterium stellerae]
MLLTHEESRPGAESVAAEAVVHETIHHFLVKPVDVGIDGYVEAGTLLEWIDFAAHSTAAQWCSGNCVAASVGNIHLDRPIHVGELVKVRATLVYTGRSSMHILITVHCSDPGRTKAPQTAQCAVVFVAFDGVGNPMKVPGWTPLTMLELQRHRQARLRMRTRARIEDAMAAESYSAEGTAPSAALRFRAASTDIDSDGKVRGGRVMRWFDEAAYACGADWAGGDVVTSYVAGIRLGRAIYVGDVVDVTARIIHTGRRSVHIGVRAVTADAVGQPLLVSQGVLVVVSVGAHGEAQAVPQWQPVSDEDRRLDRHARHLIELRQYLEPFTAATA